MKKPLLYNNFLIYKKPNLKLLLFLYRQACASKLKNLNFSNGLILNNYPEHLLVNYNLLLTAADIRCVLHLNNELENITNISFNSISKNLEHKIKQINVSTSYLFFMYKRFNLLNRASHLSSLFYYRYNSKKNLFPIRFRPEPKNIIKKLYKNIENTTLDKTLVQVSYKSLWWQPATYSYNKKYRTHKILYNNSFNRVLINNLVNLILPNYLRIFYNIFKHFNKLLSKRVMLLYLNDYYLFNLFMKKKYNSFTIKWFHNFNKNQPANKYDMFFHTNYIRSTMLKITLKKKLISLCKQNKTYMYGWLYVFSLQELLRKIDSKIFFFIKFFRLMQTKGYQQVKFCSRSLFFNAPIKTKSFITEFISIMLMSIKSRDAKFIFDFLFKYFNTMHFKLQFKFISFMKSFLRRTFSLLVYYFKIKGIRIIFKGKIGKTGSIRKKKLILQHGKYSYSNLYLQMDEYSGPIFTPTGVIGTRIIITY